MPMLALFGSLALRPRAQSPHHTQQWTVKISTATWRLKTIALAIGPSYGSELKTQISDIGLKTQVSNIYLRNL